MIFDWDNLFLGWLASFEAASKDIAYSNIIQIIQARTFSGFVPNYASGQEASYDRTEPQIGAIIVREVFRRWGDAWFVEKVFDALVSWSDWFWDYRRGDGQVALGPDGRSNLISLGSDPNAPGTNA